MVEEFLKDYGSTTSSFKQMSDKYRLDVLSNGFIGEEFYRIVAIYVDDLGVMLGLSVTHQNHATFLDILQNAKHIPIGVQLFNPENQITRTNVSIFKINVSQITNLIITDYLALNGIIGEIYVRQSDFIKNNETMSLIEYILPGLEVLLDKHKDKE